VLVARLRQKIIRKNRFIIVAAALVGVFFVSQLAVQAFGVVTFFDAKWNSMHGSRPSTIYTAQFLSSHYSGGTILVMTGSAQQNDIRQASGIPLKNFDTVLDLDSQKPSFKEPWQYASYIVLGKRPDNSAANASKYWLDRQGQLSNYFDTVYQNEYYIIMAKKHVQPLEVVHIGNTTRTYIIHQR
jgi:hypothetical protein